MKSIRPLQSSLLFIFLALMLAGCQTAYYSTMEKFGVHKRDIMADRVTEARDSQEEAKEQFASALDRFNSVVKYDGGTLEGKYKQIKAELDTSEERAKDVSSRIDAVEDVAQALFDEWADELEQYSSASLKQSSQRTLTKTKNQYAKLISAMKRAEAKMEPVLRPLRDQVLFLKHNLNARAISSLESELISIKSDVAVLIRDMEVAIAEADVFIQNHRRGLRIKVVSSRGSHRHD